MIDYDKLKRFEKTLNKYNRTPVIAQIWNELEPGILQAAKHAEDIEATNLQLLERLQFHYKTTQVIAIAERTLAQCKRWKGTIHGC